MEIFCLVVDLLGAADLLEEGEEIGGFFLGAVALEDGDDDEVDSIDVILEEYYFLADVDTIRFIVIGEFENLLREDDCIGDELEIEGIDIDG
jgi:hypothetical protein